MIRPLSILWLGLLAVPAFALLSGEETPAAKDNPPPPAGKPASAASSASTDGSAKSASPSAPAGRAKLPANPSELYTRLSAATRPQWRTLYRPTVTRCLDGRQQAALGLGAVTADLFLAAQARDAQQVRNLMQDEETIEKTLGLITPMAARRTEMLSAAENADWPALITAIDKLTTAHRRHFREQKDEPLAELAYIGEWLRALQICHAVAIQKELDDYRLAIGSPALIVEMNRRLDTINPGGTESSRCLKVLHRHLNNLGKLWPEGDHTYSNLPDRLQRSSEMLREAVCQLLQEETASPAPAAPASPQPGPGTLAAPSR